MTTEYYLSKFCCPVCKQPLCARKEDKGYFVWCGMANCNSLGANEGAHGRTEQKATEVLYAKLGDGQYTFEEDEETSQP